MSPIPLGILASAGGVVPVGQQTFTSSITWTVPANVTSISAVAVDGGGGGTGSQIGRGAGGKGGSLYYRNNIPVTPGESLSISVGSGGFATGPSTAGGFSQIKRGSTVLVGIDGPNTASYSGGNGGAGGQSAGSGGGGGAAGYSGNGGAGGAGFSPEGMAGSGGGGGGGYAGVTSFSYRTGSGGGGVGLLGQGDSGAGGTNPEGSRGGRGGSGGTFGAAGGLNYFGASGGQFGGGSGAAEYIPGETPNGSTGTSGAIRIIWGPGRSYPFNAQNVVV